MPRSLGVTITSMRPQVHQTSSRSLIIPVQFAHSRVSQPSTPPTATHPPALTIAQRRLEISAGRELSSPEFTNTRVWDITRTHSAITGKQLSERRRFCDCLESTP